MDNVLDIKLQMTDSKTIRMGYAIQQGMTQNDLSELKQKGLMPLLIENGFFTK